MEKSSQETSEYLSASWRGDLQQPKPPCFIASNLFVFGVNVGLERFVKRLFDTITNTSPVQLASSDQLCPGTRNRFRSSALELEVALGDQHILYNLILYVDRGRHLEVTKSFSEHEKKTDGHRCLLTRSRHHKVSGF